jgi:hypothetical protein
MRRFTAGLLVLFPAVAGPSVASAAQFASGVPQFVEGDFKTFTGAHYANTGAALGAPSPVVGADTAFAGILSPFNSHYSTNELVGFGRGGSLTLEFGQAVPVTGTPQIGIFTNTALVDAAYPAGSADAVAKTYAADEYGERTAVVEVASSPSDFRSLGRVVFNAPTNFFADATGPYQFPAPGAAADFDKPFTQPLSAFNGKDFAGILGVLDGSAGGTWLSVPLGLGLDEIRYVRLSDTKWLLPDGSLADQLQSAYFPDPPFIKPADLFVDAAVLVPEPSGMLWVAVGALALRRRRRA